MTAPSLTARLAPLAACCAMVSAACALVVGLEDKEPIEAEAGATDAAAVDSGNVVTPDAAVGTGTTVATGQAMPWGVAVDATHVYWTNEGDGTVLRVARAGGAPTVIARSQPEPHQIFADATRIIWHNANLANRNGDDAGNELLEVAQLTKADAGTAVAPTKIDSERGVSKLRRLAISSGPDKYLWASIADEVRRYERDTEQNKTTVLGNLDGKDPTALGADLTSVYWFLQTPHELWRAGLEFEQGGAAPIAADPQLLATLPAAPEIADLVADEGIVFAITRGGVVLRVDAADAGVPATLASGLAFPHGLTQDQNHLYITHGNDDAPGQAAVVMVPKSGGAVTVLAAGLGKLRGVAVGRGAGGSREVYWASYDDGTIRSVLVP